MHVRLAAFSTLAFLASSHLVAQRRGLLISQTTSVQTSVGRLHVDIYVRQGINPVANLFYLHGDAGVLSPDKTTGKLDNAGEHDLACAGFRVLIPHYFDLSQINSTADRELMLKVGPRWADGISDLMVSRRKHDHIPILLYGYSLGAFLAVRMAVDHPGLVRGVSLLCFGKIDSVPTINSGLPAFLMQKGILDSVVPSSAAAAFISEYKGSIPPLEILYPSFGHNLFYESGGIVTAVTEQYFHCLLHDQRSLLFPCNG